MTGRSLPSSLVAGVALLALVATGCSDEKKGLDSSSNEQIAEALTDSLQHHQDDWSLQRVQQELLRRCMQAHHLTYFVTSSGPFPTQRLLTEERPEGISPDGYGLYEREVAQHAGTARGADRTSRQDAYLQSLPSARQAEYGQVFFGPDSARQTLKLPGGAEVSYPTQGCLAEALTKIYGDVQKQAELEAIPQIVRSQMNAKVAADPSFRAAVDAWRACMSSRGFTYKSPSDALNQLQGDYARAASPQDVRTKERTVARADATCDATSSLRQVQSRARIKALESIASDLERQTLALLQIRSDAVKRARELLTASPPGA